VVGNCLLAGLVLLAGKGRCGGFARYSQNGRSERDLGKRALKPEKVLHRTYTAKMVLKMFKDFN
jgi:hypothetical protein